MSDKVVMLGGLRDLAEYGVDPLTGEACGLGYRVLCDVTARGKRALARCLGLPDISLPPAWNSGTASDPHVGSFLMAPETFVPLAVFCLLEAGFEAVYLSQRGQVVGVRAGADETDLKVASVLGGGFVRSFRPGGTAGDRNVHEMSCRVF
jgi:hypothetical protein